MTERKKLVLVDGNSLAYRAFFALPLLSNEKGIHTNAVYGFTTILMKMLEEEKPTHMLVAFDAGKTTFRHKTFKEYKGGRQKTPPELSEQLPFIRELLDAYQILRYELENYEADDIIGTLAKSAEKDGFEVKIFSGDKDLTQLATEGTTVAITKKGITDVEYYTPEHVREKYGLTPEQIIDMKGLMGDSSDNIPGVPGVGEKTAIKLLKQFHTIEELLSSIDEVNGKKLKEKLEEFKEQALMSKELATITTEAPLEVTLDSLGYEGFDREAVVKIFKDLGFNSLLERIGEEPGEKEEEQFEEINVMIKTDITDDLFASPASLVVEQLGDNYHEAPILGFSIVNEHGAFFIPEETAVQSDRFKEWAEDESKKKWVFDAKRAAVALRWRGIELKGAEFDVLLAAYIINPGHSYDDVASVAKEHQLHIVAADEAVYGKGAKQAVPDEKELADHLARKAKAISLLREKLLDELEKNEQLDLFEALEMPLAHILGEMESIGVQVDVGRLKKMGEELSAKLAEYEKKIHESAGETFNINSPKQLGVILFEKLGLPAVKKTKTGYSTSADVLEKLRDKHVIIEDILHYRQIGKLQSTYVEGLLKVIKKDSHKVHTRFNQALTQTGRLSSTDPNLQNIPIRLEEGRKIRQAFVPSQKGWLMFAADYSQIELRVLAHISKDKNLIEAFTNDMDVHTKTAMDVFHVSEEEVTPAMRRQAKAVNFGIVYGISDYGLSQNLGITRKEAAAFIERYFHSFQGVKEYMEETVQEAKQKGYVTTLLSRRRYIPELTSRNFNLRSFAERTAMNTPIQGSAADIIKKAMIDMADKLKEKNLKAKLLLQVHDELIFEAPEDEIKVLEKLVPEVMEHALELDVPLKMDCASGPSWYDAK
ncbi:DNA polymerase I [Bacillus paralicheniformis]|uniref:DNA polymerase I n=2 Tax=Bacillus paralicheniformis TaxID=1648923 RepID=UPI002DBD5807|nr:DNA polymerase I [Bacillus paralicheniformis]MEC1022554.1 DNA polymerase I [Bacillus paralicheniformis]MEC1026881.1 DNA polymerase I [Bacillus paralicheniformis]MEC1049667.1 DNA polymerase I [Bacillus paralicheniformis]MEC1062562.1 DNA polymerase I [Bacillus paralicheniformis]MEC1082878.1 DNA polymerase I [Bacillus paralicheniformis]